MPPVKVKVSDFVAASGRYVSEQLARADKNHNGKVSPAEAKALPADLRDNFANYKAKKNVSSVPVKDLEKSFKSYVAAAAKKADKNKDGYITFTDSAGLPKDLKDNFWNYYNATKVDGPGPVGPAPTVESMGRTALKSYVTDVLFNPANAEGEAFRYACIDNDVTTPQAAKIKADMLAEAAAWSPASADWEKSGTPPDETYAGRFFQLYTEVRFKGGKVDDVYVEID